jgi:DNA repair exonuclease SbcCD ATPase subunit
MAEQDVNLKTDVALIQKDLKQIERFFTKFDAALTAMADMSQKVAVQGEILKNTAEKLQSLELKMAEHKADDIARAELLGERLEETRKSAYNDHEKLAKENQQNRKERNEEIMTQLARMNGSLDARLEKLDDRIKTLEHWKWYIMGLGAIVTLIAVNIKWTGLF